MLFKTALKVKRAALVELQNIPSIEDQLAVSRCKDIVEEIDSNDEEFEPIRTVLWGRSTML